MPVEVAQGILNLTASFDGIQRDIERQLRGVNTRRAGQDAGDEYSTGFGGSAKKITAALSAGFAAVKIGDFAKSAISQASDLNETVSKSNQIFGANAQSINKWSDTSAKAMGLSKGAALDAAAGYGNMLTQLGFTGDAAAKASTGAVQLAADLGSFNNLDTADVNDRISAALRGEYDSLQAVIPNINAARVQQEAMAATGKTNANQLTAQEKAAATLAIVYKDAGPAIGDFARTSGGLANQQKILSAQWDQMKGKLGAAILPAVTATVTALNERLFPTLEGLGTKASAAWGILAHGDFQGAAAGLGEEDSPLVSALFKARDTFAGLKPQLEAAWGTLTTGDTFGITGADAENNPLIGIASKLREFGLDTFDKLRGIWDTLWDTAEKLWNPIKQIATSLFEAFSSVQSLTGGMSPLEALWNGLLWAFQKVADLLNAVLVPVLTWLGQFMEDNQPLVLGVVAAFVAWRTAVLAATVVTWAFTAAQTAWAVATAIAEGAMKALNFVMNMSPIMKVVLALTALAAAVVWAYTNVGWFRDAVDAAWSFIQSATTALWEGVIKPAFNWIADNIHVVGDFFVAMWNAAQPVFEFLKASFENFIGVIQGVISVVAGVFTGNWTAAWEGIQRVFGAVWDQIKNIITTVWTTVFMPVFSWIDEHVPIIGDTFQWLWDHVINPVWNAIGTIILGTWNNVISPVFGFITNALSTLGSFFSGLWDMVQNVWTWIQEKITTAWTWVRDQVFTPLNAGVQGVGGFFSGLWATVQNVWQWIQDKISTVWLWLNQNVFAPLNLALSTMGTFFNNLWTTVETVWNNVSTFFVNVAKGISDAVATVKKGIDDIKLAIDGFFERFKNWGGTQAGGVLGNIDIAHGARGAVVPGTDPGRRDNMLMAVRSGESIFVPEFTQAIGGESTVHAWNRAAEQGRLGDVLGPGYALGGVIGGQQAGQLVSAQALKLLGQKRDEMKAAIEAAAAMGSAAVNLAEFTTSQDPSSFGWARASNIQPFNWNGFLTGVAGGTQNLWAALLNALAPSIPGGIKTLGGFDNRNNVNNPGVPSFHAYGLAMDANAPWNPNGVSGYGRAGQYVIPSGPAHSLAARYGMLWGGDFTGTPDPMHFEIHLPPSAIGAAISGLSAPAAGALPLGGSGVERWRARVMQALGLTGQPAGYANYVLHQMDTESSGNPRAINLTDSNARRGTPSKGLMQVIDPTFQHYRLPQLSGDIYDPLANIVAAIRYVLDRYGSIPAGMRGVAYDTGGWLMPGMVGGNLGPRPEAVLNPAQSDALITHARNLEAGFAGSGPVVLNINLDNSDPLQVAVAGMIRAGIDQDRIDMTFVAREMAGQSL